MKEYPNIFISENYLRMNVRKYSVVNILQEWIYKYIRPCSILTNECTKKFEYKIWI